MGRPAEEDDVEVRVEGPVVLANVVAVCDGLAEEVLARLATGICHERVSSLADTWEGDVFLVVVGLAAGAGAPHEDAWFHWEDA